jgi:dienelactone hydrolase
MTRSQTLKLEHAGAALEGFLAMPVGPGPHPAVMAMHDAHGLSDRMRGVARRLANAGYLALATDMYGGGLHHPVPEAAGVAIAPLWNDPELLRQRVIAWLDLLRARPEADPDRIGAIGYCFGGQCVLELARSGADVKAVVSYHGILTTAKPAEPSTVKARIAVYTGAKDPYVPRQDVTAFRDEMIAAGARWQITEFGEAHHSFTDPGAGSSGTPGVAYDRLADSISWAGTEAMLTELL